MSMIVSRNVECSQCKRMLGFTVFESLNVSLDPEYREKVLDQSAFRMRCPDCGHTTVLEYGFLYHDMDRHYMIDVCWDAKVLFKPSGTYVQNFIAQLKADPPYRFRNVLGYGQLTEKIRIFDAGLNDYAVEALKAIYRQELNIPGNQELRFSGFRSGKLFLLTTAPDGTQREIVTDRYAEAERQVLPVMPPETDHRFVHEKFFLQLVKSHRFHSGDTR